MELTDKQIEEYKEKLGPYLFELIILSRLIAAKMSEAAETLSKSANKLLPGGK